MIVMQRSGLKIEKTDNDEMMMIINVLKFKSVQPVMSSVVFTLEIIRCV